MPVDLANELYSSVDQSDRSALECGRSDIGCLCSAVANLSAGVPSLELERGQ
jgi:hypothetical protein